MMKEESKDEKYASIGSEYLFARSKPWPDEHVGMPTVCQNGKKDLLGVRQ